MVRASACHAEGRGFESRHSRHPASRVGDSQGHHLGVGIMDALLLEYLPILVFLGIAMVVSGVCIGGSWLVARQKPDMQKLSAYECGFEPFENARLKFDVRYYLVAILFIIFDLDIALLFPWAVSFGKIGLFGYWSVMIFIAVFVVGFIYEWRKGALEWE